MASEVQQILPIQPSKTKFDYTANDEDDIVRVCGKLVWGCEERSVILPTWRPFLRSGGFSPFVRFHHGQRTTPPHYLQKIPLEIFETICISLDIESLIALYQSSVWLRQRVESCSKFQKVLLYAEEDLRFVLQTYASQHATLAQLLDVLYNPLCSFCNREAGMYVYLPKMLRYCENCLCWRADDELSTTYLESVESTFDFNEDALARLPKAVCSQHYRDFSLSEAGAVCWQDVVDLYQEQNEGSYPPEELKEYVAFEESLSVSWPCRPLDPTTNSGLGTYTCNGCWRASRSDFYGFFDPGELVMEISRVRKAQYTKDSYLHHFEWCAAAQELWKSHLAELARAEDNDDDDQ